MSGVTRAIIGVALVAATVVTAGAAGVGLAAFLSSSVIGSVAFSLGTSLLLGAAAQALARTPRLPQQVITGNVRGSSETHLIVFGERRVGGKIVQLGTAGSTGEKLYIGLAHSVVHPGGCEGITGAWFNDAYLPAADLGALDGSTDVGGSTPLAGQANLAFYRGTGTQAADSASVTDGIDTATDYRRGICWTRFLLRRNSDAEAFAEAFPGGIPTLTVALRGWRCYDPREDDTRGGAGDQRADNPLTWTWTRNAALCAATYYIAARTDGGCGFAPTGVDWDAVAAAANICDEPLSTPAGDMPRFTCDIVLDTRDSWQANLQKILDCMGGFAPRVGGVRTFYAAAYRSPTATIDGNWLRGAVQITPKQPIDDSANRVVGTFPDETQNYQLIDTPVFSLDAFVTADGRADEVLLNYEGVTQPYRAQYLNQIALKRRRRQETLELPVNLRGLDVACGETVIVDLPAEGIDGEIYRVQEWRWADDAPVLRLRADALSDYTPETFTVPLVAGTVTQTDESLGAPQDLVALGITGGVALNWRNPDGTTASNPLIAVYLLQRSIAGADTWTELDRVSGYTYTDVTGTAGTQYDYRVFAVNARGQMGAASNIATATFGSPFSIGGPSLVNPGFELGDTGWAKDSGWTINMANPRTILGVMLPAAWSGRHDGPAFSGPYNELLNDGAISAAAGDVLSAEGWIHPNGTITGGQGRVVLVFYDDTGTEVSRAEGNTVQASIGSIAQYYPSRVNAAVAPAGSAYARLAFVARGPTNVDDASITVNSRNLDEIPDGDLFGKILKSELSTNVHRLNVAGSGSRLGDGRNLPIVRHGNAGAQWAPMTLEASFDAADPANVTLSMPAATLTGGGFMASYGAASTAVTQARDSVASWLLYLDDPDALDGGTLTLFATQNPTTAVGGENRLYVGRILVHVPATGSGTAESDAIGGGGSFAPY